jgi:hypothetical protein
VTLNPTINLKRFRSEDEDEPTPLDDFDSLNDDEDVEMSREVNAEFATHEDESMIGGAQITNIVGHNWIEGRLKLKAEWSTEQMTWEELKDLKEDQPRLTANYIVNNNVTRSQRNDRTLTWAKKVTRDLKRTARRISRLYYHFFLDENDDAYRVRRIQKNRKKKRRKITKTPTFKYGVQVPRNVKHAFELDKLNGDSYWADATKAEMKDLFDLEAFDIKSVGFHPGSAFQATTLTIIFDVKQDLRQKARLAAGGHLVDPMDRSVYSSTVKGISVKLLHIISHKAKLEQLCGDVSLAFGNAYTLEKVYAISGPRVWRAPREDSRHPKGALWPVH